MPRKGGKDRGLFERPPSSGVWWICYKGTDGKLHREKVGSKSAARDLYHKRVEQTRLQVKLGPLNRRQPTVGDLIDRYREELRTDKKPKSIREDVRHADYWRKAFGIRVAEEVQPGDIEAWKARRLEKVKAATVNRSLAFLKHLYYLAIRDGLLAVNPLGNKKVKMMREAPPPDRILQHDEEHRLKAKLLRLEWLAVVLALQTGMRQSEQLGLRRHDVDLRKRLVCLGDPKSREREYVRLNPVAFAAMKELLDSHQSEWVFPARRGSDHMTGSALYQRFADACEKTGIKGVKWHTLRHTFISRLAMLGVSILVVKELARHRSLTMTLRYAHLAPGHADEALKSLADQYPADLELSSTDSSTENDSP